VRVNLGSDDLANEGNTSTGSTSVEKIIEVSTQQSNEDMQSESSSEEGQKQQRSTEDASTRGKRQSSAEDPLRRGNSKKQKRGGRKGTLSSCSRRIMCICWTCLIKTLLIDSPSSFDVCSSSSPSTLGRLMSSLSPMRLISSIWGTPSPSGESDGYGSTTY